MESNITYKISKEIIENVDIVEIIGGFIKLKRVGSNYVGVCPFHNDTKPSLTINQKKKIWKCFVCGTGGTVIKFVQEFKKCSTLEAIQIIATKAKIDLSKYQSAFSNTKFDPKTKYLFDSIKEANSIFNASLKDKKNQTAINYLNERGIDNETIKHFNIGYAPKSGDMLSNILTNNNNMFGEDYDKNLIWNVQQLSEASLVNIDQNGKSSDFFIDRIIFPITNSDGVVVGFSGRTISNKEPKYLNSKETKIFNKSKTLYNYSNLPIKDIDILIIVEGYMDAIAFYRAGYPNVVATMGTNMSDEQITLIKAITSLKGVILAFDNDNAGTQANITNAKKLTDQCINVYVTGDYDKSIKDIDELLKKNGKNSVVNIIKNKRDYISFLIDSYFSSQKDDCDKLHLTKIILSSMIDAQDMLLKTKHIEQLAKVTGYDKSDLLNQYDALLKKIIGDPIKPQSKQSISTTSMQEKFSKPFIKINNGESKELLNIKTKWQTVFNGLTLLLNELIHECLTSQQLCKECENLYLQNLKDFFSIQCLLLKIICVNNDQKITKEFLLNFIKENYPDMYSSTEHYFADTNNPLLSHKKNEATSYTNGKALINNINKKKIDFEVFNLEIERLNEEKKGEQADQAKIIELHNKIKLLQLKKNKK
ncbi:MAG: DNA primase [Mycoplasmoidaceae bacterium]|nr:MAG: DNA primase [Mycoplasmoidaceae bacterium]